MTVRSPGPAGWYPGSRTTPAGGRVPVGHARQRLVLSNAQRLGDHVGDGHRPVVGVLGVAYAALAEAKQQFDAIAQVPLDASDARTILDAWDRASIVIEDAFGPGLGSGSSSRKT